MSERLMDAEGALRRGFTLIELMIVAAIIGILAAIAIPKFADLIRKSNEGATRGNLGAVRSAISVYYSDMEGQYPDDPASLTVDGRYLRAIPTAKLPPHHPDSNALLLGSDDTSLDDAGGWIYANDPSVGEFYGTFVVNCSHTDTKGEEWASY